MKFSQEYDGGGIIILDDLNEKQMNDPSVQAMLKQLIISQEYYELPKPTIRANSKIYHIFKTKNFRDVINIYQDKSSTDMTINEFKLLTATCWNEKYQPLTTDMTKNNYTGRY